MFSKKNVFLSSILILIIGIPIYFFHSNKSGLTDAIALPKTYCKYTLVNPRRCEPDLQVKTKEYTVLKNELAEYIEAEKGKKKIITISVYFRDLQGGPIMSIESQDDFTPASLLKLPLMIAYYKKAQDDPSLLQKKIKATASSEVSTNVIPEHTAQEGKVYTIDELITLLITQSDNTASQILVSYLQNTYPQEDFVFTLGDLGIIDPRQDIDEQYVTPQLYASILRVLYNSSYLNTEMSNKALELLTKSAFSDGIEAGVDKGIVVANKFGERKKGNEQQLHDCGIVYYPKNPYMLCIMTKGHETQELIPIIKEISKRVFDEVKRRN